jgi:hypothetical protein
MDEDDENNQNTPSQSTASSFGGISPIDKSIIQQRFFELSN